MPTIKRGDKVRYERMGVVAEVMTVTLGFDGAQKDVKIKWADGDKTRAAVVRVHEVYPVSETSNA